VIKEQNHVRLKEVLDYDLILIRSPNHMGGPTRGIKKFIDKLGKLGLEGKKGAIFYMYVKKNVDKAVRKMEKRINESFWPQTCSSRSVSKSSSNKMAHPRRRDSQVQRVW
jgi:flavodoxin